MTSFIKFWSALANHEDAKRRYLRVKTAIDNYNPAARSVLELGVGMGNVITRFPKRFELYGLDVQKEYVQHCRKILPKGSFVVNSMHLFKFPRKFDVIYSVHDSVNFLPDFAHWKMMRQCVAAHLNSGGLFVFDMYTPACLDFWKGQDPMTSEFSMGHTITRAIVKSDTLTWDYRVLEHMGKEKFQQHKFLFVERIYPVHKIISLFSSEFEIVEQISLDNGRRMHFAWRKK